MDEEIKKIKRDHPELNKISYIKEKLIAKFRLSNQELIKKFKEKMSKSNSYGVLVLIIIMIYDI